MTGPRWERLEEVVRAALEKEGAARAEFLRQACGDDADLLAEAESLLSFETQAEVAIAGAVKGAAVLFQAGQSGFAEGDRLGATASCARSAAAAWAPCTWPSATMTNSASWWPSNW